MTHPIFPSTLPSTTSPTSPRSRRVEREREREKKERDDDERERELRTRSTRCYFSLHNFTRFILSNISLFFLFVSFSLSSLRLDESSSFLLFLLLFLLLLLLSSLDEEDEEDKKEFLFQLFAPFRQRVQNHRRSERHARARVTRFEPIEMFFFIRDERRRERERPEE